MEIYTSVQVEQAITAAVNYSLLLGFVVGFLFYFLAFDFGGVVRNIIRYFRHRQKTKAGRRPNKKGCEAPKTPPTI